MKNLKHIKECKDTKGKLIPRLSIFTEKHDINPEGISILARHEHLKYFFFPHFIGIFLQTLTGYVDFGKQGSLVLFLPLNQVQYWLKIKLSL